MAEEKAGYKRGLAAGPRYRVGFLIQSHLLDCYCDCMRNLTRWRNEEPGCARPTGLESWWRL